MIECRFLPILSCGLLATATSHASDFALIEANFDSQRIASEATSQDSSIGIQHFVDPELARAIGARGLKIWLDGRQGAVAGTDYYLRVARSPLYLMNTNLDVGQVFGDDLREPAIIATSQSFPSYSGEMEEIHAWIRQNENVSDPTAINCADASLEISKSNWDLLYQGQYESADFYLSASMSRIREYMLERRYGVDARFVHEDSDRERLREFVVKAKKNIPEGTAKAFIYDSDPFAYLYRLQQRERIAQYLTDRRGCIHYQWVRVRNGVATKGDIHSIRLPRPLNISVIGDSYTSGEAAPLFASRDFGNKYVVESEGSEWTVAGSFGSVLLSQWIEEYGGRPGHRSVNSGWESAVNQTVKSRFTDLAVNFYNVSSSGAQVEEWNEDGRDPEREEEIPLDEISTIWGAEDAREKALTTAYRQMHALDALMEEDGGQNIIDILGFTFGGNDAKFSKVITAMVFLDSDDLLGTLTDFVPYTLNNIGTDRNYPGEERDPFYDPDGDPISFPEMASFSQMVDHGREALRRLGGNIETGAFSIAVKKVIVGNYPNPLGSMNIYNPAGRILSGIAQIDSTESGWVRRIINPSVNEDMVASNAGQFGYILADTLTRLPYAHNRHLGRDLGVGWFEPVLSTDTEDERYPYAFHPNAAGHFNVYRPVYLEKLNECLDSSYRSEQWQEESPSIDLALGSSDLVYDTAAGGLRIIGQVTNRSRVAPSEAMRIDMRAFLGLPKEEQWTPDAIPLPVRDSQGSIVQLPPLEAGETRDFSFLLAVGNETSSTNSLLVSHYLGLQEREDVKRLIGEPLSPEAIARRVASAPFLARGEVTFDFALVPVSTPEDGYYSGCTSTFGKRRVADFLESIDWLQEQYPEAYELVLNQGQDLGISTPELLNPEILKENPALFTIFDVNPDAGFDRSVPREQVELSQLRGIAERVRLTKKIGILDPAFSYLSRESFEDRVSVKRDGVSRGFKVEDFGRIADVLAYDGRPVEIVFHEALPLSDQDEQEGLKREFVEHQASFEVSQVVHGIERDAATGSLVSGEVLNARVRFAADTDTAVDLGPAAVLVRDPITGARFQTAFVRAEDPAARLNLSSLLLHSGQVRVEVMTFTGADEQIVGYNYLNRDAPAVISQRFVDVRQERVLMECKIVGPGAGEYARGFAVEIFSEDSIQYGANPPEEKRFVYRTSPLELTTEEVGEGLFEARWILEVPLDFVHSGFRRMRLVLGQGESAVVRESSLDLGEIRRHALGVVEPTLRRVAINVVSGRRAEVFADVPGLVTVDVSENLEHWERLVTSMVAGGSTTQFELPPSESGKLFLRASLLKEK